MKNKFKNRHQEDHSLRSTRAKSWQDPISTNKPDMRSVIPTMWNA
jgi:hypothetical protein